MMGHIRKAIMKLTFVIIVISVTFITVSCSSQKEGTAYSVYYLNEDGTSLTEGRVYIESQDAVSVANELIEKMNVAKGRHTSIIKPVYVSQPAVEINGIYADVYYDSSYYGMKPSTEVLYRAAVVKELSQISDVLYVRFYVDGKDAVYEDGTIIGNMSAEDFVDTKEGDIADVKWKTINLYFANKSGDALVKNSQRICYNKNVSVEKVVVEQLIKGTSEAGCYQSIPSSTKLLSISVVDKICYVNFSQEFVNDMVNARSNIAIYSVVNSLAGLDGIDGVKIMVKGNSNLMYRDVISLDTVFYMNNELINKDVTDN